MTGAVLHGGSLCHNSTHISTVVTGSLTPGSSKGFRLLKAMVVVQHELNLPPGGTLYMAALARATCLGGHPAGAP